MQYITPEEEQLLAQSYAQAKPAQQEPTGFIGGLKKVADFLNTSTGQRLTSLIFSNPYSRLAMLQQAEQTGQREYDTKKAMEEGLRKLKEQQIEDIRKRKEKQQEFEAKEEERKYQQIKPLSESEKQKFENEAELERIKGGIDIEKAVRQIAAQRENKEQERAYEEPRLDLKQYMDLISSGKALGLTGEDLERYARSGAKGTLETKSTIPFGKRFGFGKRVFTPQETVSPILKGEIPTKGRFTLKSI